MTARLATVLLLLACGCVRASTLPTTPDRLVSTYSIVARDPVTGELGVAVQSHWFDVGALVAWAEAGVGAVATQAKTRVEYGPEGLRLMREGKSAPEALRQLLETDPERQHRQVAMVDAKGSVGVWTGESCIDAKGHLQGEGFSVQANLMQYPSVWPEMARAYREGKGSLGERMLAALEAAEASGGDVRGAQSAAMLVVPGSRDKGLVPVRRIDLRVADHRRPVAELGRLLRLRLAYEASAQGEAALVAGEKERARKSYAEARRLAPENREVPFWEAIAWANAGELPTALARLRPLVSADPRWRVVLERLPSGKVLDAKTTRLLLEALDPGADQKASD